MVTDKNVVVVLTGPSPKFRNDILYRTVLVQSFLGQVLCHSYVSDHWAGPKKDWTKHVIV